MSVGSAFNAEREELDAVLRSGIFGRSPSLAQFLNYVCNKVFEGKGDEIKEYNVAVEALGRPQDFDQKKDSIVRVEAHRLRKRLQEYYRGEGADHPIQIALPAGTYVPAFVLVAQPVAVAESNGDQSHGIALLAPEPDTEVLSAEVDFLALPEPAVQSGRRWWVWAIVFAAVTLAVTVALLRYTGPERNAATPPQTATAAAGAIGDEIRMMAGSTAERYVDEFGQIWTADRFFTGGSVISAAPRPILLTRDPSLFLTRREGEFRYDIPLRRGPHELRLYFAETVFGDTNDAGGGESSRVFHIRANGRAIFDPVDIINDAGGANTADIRVFKDIEPAADGQLHLEFVPFLKETPFINGIEILPSQAGRTRPVRVMPREKPFRDSVGREWSSDRFYRGGVIVSRHEFVEGADDQELFRNERYGNFSYTVPVDTNSRYTVKLRFAEYWFGPGRTGRGGAGSRLFDVYCNGKTLLKNFDIFADAGGSLRAVEKTFRGLEPNAQGKLKLEFVPVRNYALVNAIEVIDEGR